MLTHWKESYDQPRQHIAKKRHCFANKGPSNQGYSFSSGHVSIWKLDYKESWGLKNWCFWTVVFQKTLESPLDCKEIQPVCPIGDQSCVFIRRPDVEAETPILCPPCVKTWPFGKTLMLGKIEGRKRRERQRMRWLDGITKSIDMGLGWSWWWTGIPGMLQFMCHKDSDMTEWLSWTEYPNSLVVLKNWWNWRTYTFFSLSLNFAIRSWWSQPL